jgi:hypothetical protein
MKKFPALISALAFAISIPCAGQTASFKTLIDEALRNNLDIRKQELAVSTAKDAIPGIWKIEDSKIAVSGSYNYSESGTGPGAASPFSEELSVTIPVFDQLSLSGRINDKLESSASVTINPFNYDTTALAAEENYRKALDRLAALKKETGYSIENSVLVWNVGGMNLSYLEANYKVAGEKYDVKKKQYNLGKATYDELLTEEQAYIDARQKYYDGRNTALRNEESLFGLLGARTDKASIPSITGDELFAMVDARAAIVSEYNTRQAVTDDVRTLTLELATLRKELAALVPVQPGITISANAGMPKVSFGASASISISTRDFKFKEIDDLKANIAIKEEELSHANYTMSLDKQVLSQSIDISKELFDSAKKDLERADTDLKENDFLYTKGERTIIELELARLNSLASRIRLYQSAASLYKAQADYLKLF